MKKTITYLFVLFALATFVSCASEPVKEAPKPVAVTALKGTVSLPKTGGLIVIADGKEYIVTNPEKVDKKLQKEKGKIEVSGNALTGQDGKTTLEVTAAK